MWTLKTLNLSVLGCVLGATGEGVAIAPNATLGSQATGLGWYTLAVSELFYQWFLSSEVVMLNIIDWDVHQLLSIVLSLSLPKALSFSLSILFSPLLSLSLIFSQQIFLSFRRSNGMWYTRDKETGQFWIY